MTLVRSRGVADAEDLAQDVLLRVLQKLAAGERIICVRAYARKVAEFVLKEHERRKRCAVLETPQIAAPPVLDNSESELDCLERCLQRLPAKERKFILAYQNGTPAQREELARSRGVSENALRIQAHHVRRKLRECVEECLRRQNAEPA